MALNLGEYVSLGERFDLALCLEGFAEHLAEEDVGQLVGNLVRHSDVVVFSAAIPGRA